MLIAESEFDKLFVPEMKAEFFLSKPFKYVIFIQRETKNITGDFKNYLKDININIINEYALFRQIYNIFFLYFIKTLIFKEIRHNLK